MESTDRSKNTAFQNGQEGTNPPVISSSLTPEQQQEEVIGLHVVTSSRDHRYTNEIRDSPPNSLPDEA